MNAVILRLAISFAIATLVTSPASADLKKVRPIKPLFVLSGPDSKVKEESLERITTIDEWKRAWAAHRGTSIDNYYDAPPQVDFDRCMIVAIYRGTTFNITRLHVESIAENKASILIRFEDMGYQTATIVTENSRASRELERELLADGGPKPEVMERYYKEVIRKREDDGGVDRVTPYALVVLNRSNKNIIVEESTRRYRGQPPIWKEWKRIPSASGDRS